jgi:hypothetical protein
VSASLKTPLQLGSAIPCINEVRVCIDEPGDDRAAACVDPRRAFLYVHSLCERRRISDVGDASVERGDDGVCQRRDVALGEPAARRWPGAGGDDVSVFDQKVRP